MSKLSGLFLNSRPPFLLYYVFIMFNRFILLGTFCLFLFSSCAPKFITELYAPPKPITTDGQAFEYEILRFYDHDSKAAYTMSNDGQNLYMLFRFDDEPVQIKVLRAGLELYIDTATTAVQQFGIFYPLPGGIGRGIEEAPDANGQNLDVKLFRENFKLTRSQVELKGFPGLDGLHPEENNTGIKTKIGWDSHNGLVYEVTVPLSLFYHANLTKTDVEKVFNLTLKLNAPKAPKVSSSGSSNTMGGMSSMGGMGSSMPGGTQGGAMSGSNAAGMGGNGKRAKNKGVDEMYEKRTVKMAFKLNVGGTVSKPSMEF